MVQIPMSGYTIETAKRLLAIPATSTPSECSFSVAVLVLYCKCVQMCDMADTYIHTSPHQNSGESICKCTLEGVLEHHLSSNDVQAHPQG